MRIALFGFYKYGNFGDDLMAVMFGRKLQAENISFRVYRLRPDVRAEFKFDGANSIEELLDGATAVVYGGGGAFLTTQHRDFEADLRQLCESCRERNIPLYMFSVGGAGRPYSEITEPRQRLLDYVSFVTFRNQEDALLLDQIGLDKGAIHHDVVWRTSDQFPAARKSREEPLTIGVDNSMLGKRKSRWTIWAIMHVCRLLRKPYRFVAFRQSPGERDFGGFDETICYSNGMTNFVERIAQTDLIITHRLHLGLAAMSFDIPAVQVMPQSKAVLLFNRLGLQRLVFSFGTPLIRLLWLLMNEGRIRELTPSRLTPDVREIIADANRHLSAMSRMVGIT
jgi:polysaccharide pyruvyl transferase WcaK-like protein